MTQPKPDVGLLKAVEIHGEEEPLLRFSYSELISLVKQKERDIQQSYQAGLDAGAKQERTACAEFCDRLYEALMDQVNESRLEEDDASENVYLEKSYTAHTCAAAIRQRDRGKG